MPAHVLRFWESRFSQVRPMKKGGGRRYYRPGDIALLSGIRARLYDDGLSIKQVQAQIRAKGAASVAAVKDIGASKARRAAAALPEAPAKDDEALAGIDDRRARLSNTLDTLLAARAKLDKVLQ